MSDSPPAQAEYLTCEHHWVSIHGPMTGRLRWIDQCYLCGSYNPASINEQIDAILAAADAAEPPRQTLARVLTAEVQAALAPVVRASLHRSCEDIPAEDCDLCRSDALDVLAALAEGDTTHG